jgi:hypothetical protein
VRIVEGLPVWLQFGSGTIQLTKVVLCCSISLLPLVWDVYEHEQPEQACVLYLIPCPQGQPVDHNSKVKVCQIYFARRGVCSSGGPQRRLPALLLQRVVCGSRGSIHSAAQGCHLLTSFGHFLTLEATANSVKRETLWEEFHKPLKAGWSRLSCSQQNESGHTHDSQQFMRC